jgi:hypothetical protein
MQDRDLAAGIARDDLEWNPEERRAFVRNVKETLQWVAETAAADAQKTIDVPSPQFGWFTGGRKIAKKRPSQYLELEQRFVTFANAGDKQPKVPASIVRDLITVYLQNDTDTALITLLDSISDKYVNGDLGSRITFALSDNSFTKRLVFRDLSFSLDSDDMIDINGLKHDVELAFFDCHVPHISAIGTQISDVILSKCTGFVWWFSEARFSRELSIVNCSAVRLVLRGAQFAGMLVLRGSEFWGAAAVIANLTKHFSDNDVNAAIRALIAGFPAITALDLDSARSTNGILANPITILGRADLVESHLNARLDLNDSHFVGVRDAHIAYSEFESFETILNWIAISAPKDHALDEFVRALRVVCKDSEALDLTGMRIEGAAYLCSMKTVIGKFSFYNAHFEEFADDGSLWRIGAKPRRAVQLGLDGFQYRSFIDNYHKLDPVLTPTDSDSRSMWLRLQPKEELGEYYRAQPWTQCANVLRSIGRYSDAATLLREREELYHSSLFARGKWPLGLAYGLLWPAGYGYSSLRAVIAGLFIVAIGSIVFQRAHDTKAMIQTPDSARVAQKTGQMTSQGGTEGAETPIGRPAPQGVQDFDGSKQVIPPSPSGETVTEAPLSETSTAPSAPVTSTQDTTTGARAATPGEYPPFFAIAYSLDVFLPIVSLGQDNYWIPGQSKGDGKAQWVPELESNQVYWYWYWFQVLSGWYLSTIFLASLSGLLERKS